VVSTLIAPVIMVHQTGSVISVLMGRDCGWKSGRKARLTLPTGLPEALVGAALLWLGAQSEAGATLWLAPLIAPLLAAPVLVRALDAEPA
jgi:membrane glycosyltransferase